MAGVAVGLLFAVYAVISTQREADRRRGRGMQLRGRHERDTSAEWKDRGQRRRPGCIIVTIPPRPASPTLTAAWGVRSHSHPARRKLEQSRHGAASSSWSDVTRHQASGDLEW